MITPVSRRALTWAGAFILVLRVTVLVSPTRAGPNAGGTLIVHDTGIAYTHGSISHPSPPPDCAGVDNEIEAEAWTVWKVYAAFNPYASPRLKTVTWGITLTAGAVVLNAGLPDLFADFAIVQGGWPGTDGAGIGMSFGTTRTATVIECQWFGGYAYSLPAAFGTGEHPTQETVFVDDGNPPVADRIAGHSMLGFGQSGFTNCPEVVLPGACCFADGSCALLLEYPCDLAGGAFQGGECAPNPCPQPPPMGACCVVDFAGRTCVVLAQPACEEGGGSFHGGPCDPTPCPEPPPPPSGGEGGENIALATAIPGLPFLGEGNTCDHLDDYDYACPYTGSISPDLVYRFVPEADHVVTIDLCSSSYDTKVYVYENVVGTPIACSDDGGCGYSGRQSRLENVSLRGGNAYYLVVDGRDGACGPYALWIEIAEPCIVPCPEGGLIEGEPSCRNNYYDGHNGGCNTTGWYPVNAYYGDACADVCGTSCTYLYNGHSYRDTDWYVAYTGEGTLRGTCMAEFPVQLLLIHSPVCSNLAYVLEAGGPCETVSFTYDFPRLSEVWFWVGPTNFTGLRERDYVLHVCGLERWEPTTVTSWGALKARFSRALPRRGASNLRPRDPSGTSTGPGGSGDPGWERVQGPWSAKGP